MHTYKILATIGALVVLLSSCSCMSPKQQRALSGGAIGAGTGAAISAIAGGSILAGTAIGAGAGVVGGLVYDEMKKR